MTRIISYGYTLAQVSQIIISIKLNKLSMTISLDYEYQLVFERRMRELGFMSCLFFPERV